MRAFSGLRFVTCQPTNRVPLPGLQFLLGHTSTETTMIYTHPLAEAQRVAVEQMASILLPNAPNRPSDTNKGRL